MKEEKSIGEGGAEQEERGRRWRRGREERVGAPAARSHSLSRRRVRRKPASALGARTAPSIAALSRRWWRLAVSMSDSFWTLLSDFSLPERSMLRRSKRYASTLTLSFFFYSSILFSFLYPHLLLLFLLPSPPPQVSRFMMKVRRHECVSPQRRLQTCLMFVCTSCRQLFLSVIPSAKLFLLFLLHLLFLLSLLLLFLCCHLGAALVAAKQQFPSSSL